MSKILEMFAIVAGIIPVVLTLVTQFETPGFGAEKKQAVLKAVELVYTQLSITAMPLEKVLGIASGIADVAVGFFNLVGWFKKSNPTPST